MIVLTSQPSAFNSHGNQIVREQTIHIGDFGISSFKNSFLSGFDER